MLHPPSIEMLSRPILLRHPCSLERHISKAHERLAEVVETMRRMRGILLRVREGVGAVVVAGGGGGDEFLVVAADDALDVGKKGG